MSPNAAGPNDHAVPRTLTITLKSDKPLKLVQMKIMDNGAIVYWEEKTPDSTQVTFLTPRDLLLSSRLILRIKYSHFKFYIFKRTIDVVGADLLEACWQREEEKQVWKRSYGRLELVVEPTNVSEILEICPQFRILVIGKSGTGKSSLINQVFGVANVHVSRGLLGEDDIDREISSKDNPKFLLHDSQCFENDKTDTLKAVHDFIERRSEMHEIKLKLHAIWVCIEIPIAGGRVMEADIGDFLKLKATGKLGDVPVIVIFTKYDRLVSQETFTMLKAGLGPMIEKAERNAKSRLQRECISPLEALVGKTIPYVSVSTRLLYWSTLNRLAEVTFTNVGQYITEAAVVMGISQKVNANVKVRASIEAGVRKYWRIGSTSFPEDVHTDIVRDWDFLDPYNLLKSDRFKILVLKSVGLDSSGTMQSRTDLWKIITYTLSLTLVMRNLFWLENILATQWQWGSSGTSHRVVVPITIRLIKQALISDYRDSLLHQIDEFTRKMTFLFQGGPDTAIKKIIQLIDSYTDEEAFRNQFPPEHEVFRGEQDETWDQRTPGPAQDTPATQHPGLEPTEDES